jgi:hypothetical protein
MNPRNDNDRQLVVWVALWARPVPCVPGSDGPDALVAPRPASFGCGIVLVPKSYVKGVLKSPVRAVNGVSANCQDDGLATIRARPMEPAARSPG